MNPGDSLVIGPHPYDGGRWTWKGPNDFYYLGREVRFKNLQWQRSRVYTGTYENPYGCESTVDIKVIVDDPEHPYIEPEKPDPGTTRIASRVALGAGKISVTRSGGDLLVNAGNAAWNVAQSRKYSQSGNAPLLLTIHDLQGVLLMRRSIDGSAVVPVTHLAKIPYIVRIKSAGKTVYQKKFK